jgi:LysR family transcriptional activator of dmlA
LSDLDLFCAVARKSSFVAVANERGTSAAHVTTRIATLEKQLGVRLFNRTTRRMGITDEGEVVFEWARKMLDDAQGMAEAVSGLRGEPRGLLKISTSLRLGREHVAPILSLLVKRYSGIEVWLELLDRRVDLIAEGFDLDIRAGDVLEPNLVAHHVVDSVRILCASPAYVKACGAPKDVADLAQHACLLHRERDQPFGSWRLTGPEGIEVVKVTGPMSANHSETVRSWALAGHGIVIASVWDVAECLESRKLVRLLPQHYQPADIWIVTASRTANSARLKVCVEFLKHHLAVGEHRLKTEIAPSPRTDQGT